MSASPYMDHLRIGSAKPDRGDRVNTWANPLNAYAERLDALELSEEATLVLCELFEEIGRLITEAVRRG